MRPGGNAAWKCVRAAFTFRRPLPAFAWCVATKPVQHDGSSYLSVSVETSKQDGWSGKKNISKPSMSSGRVKPPPFCMKVICKVNRSQHNFILFLNLKFWFLTIDLLAKGA